MGVRLIASSRFCFEDRRPQDGLPISKMSETARKSVMICEDDPDLLRVYRLALRSKYDVMTVSSGKECIEKYSEMVQNGKKVDALLLDYRLGDATGDEIATKLKRLDGTKIILISAFEIDSKVIHDLRSNDCITAFLKKPMSLQRLAAVLEASLGR
jgi:CheY-like chemotaxis protein